MKMTVDEGKDKTRVFENEIPSKIFGPKREQVTWEWIKLGIHREELHLQVLLLYRYLQRLCYFGSYSFMLHSVITKDVLVSDILMLLK
jgi:hypothetical protein